MASPSPSPIGLFELIAADEARRRAQVKLLEMYDGDTQAEKRKRTAQVATLRDVMEDYITNCRTKNGPLREGQSKIYGNAWSEAPRTEWIGPLPP